MKDYELDLKEDGMLLKKIQKSKQTIEMCRIAINQNPQSISFASKRCLDYEMCLNAVKKDVKLFEYVPEKFITKEMGEIVVAADINFLSKIPEIYRTNKLYLKAIEIDVNMLTCVPEYKIPELFNEDTSLDLIKKVVEYDRNYLKYMPLCNYVIDTWIINMKQNFAVSALMPEYVKSNIKILEFQKSLGRLKVIEKYYYKLLDKFFIWMKILNEEEQEIFDYDITAEFITFDEFYYFLDGDLSDADLRDYDFNGIDINKYNVEGAAISSDILIKLGLYDGEYYEKLKKQVEEIQNLEVVSDGISLKSETKYLRPIDDKGHVVFENEHIPIFYVSDIHLTHRIMNKFKYSATKAEIRFYIRDLARKIIKSIGTIPFNAYLLIAGDTASIFELSKKFYEELVKAWSKSSNRIVVISGNHELWDPYIDLDKNILEYRNLFKNLGITYLHNDLLSIELYKKPGIINENELLEMSIEDIRDTVQKSYITILGGIGFSGLNKKYNAVNMRYGKSFEGIKPEEALKKDIEESNKFNHIYEKLLGAIPKDKVIVLTHMKKEDWNSGEYNPNWIYINGHTHRNFFESNEKRVIYSDNQIGYRNQNIGFKYFYLDNEYDIFAYVKDGIHNITKEQYVDFNRGKQVNISYKRDGGEIYMIKKNGYYMFFVYCYFSKTSNEKHLYFMNGGRLSKLKRDKVEDLEYYYKYIDLYSGKICKVLNKYTEAQKKVSKFIKSIGGSGKVHGCIIDVDKAGMFGGFSYCHVFINPIDGKVTPYYAKDTLSRRIYKDLKTMLESDVNCKLLKDKYLKLEESSKINLPVLHYSNEIVDWLDKGYTKDSGNYLYKLSNEIKKFQYCTEKNIVRVWKEELIENNVVKRLVGIE